MAEDTHWALSKLFETRAEVDQRRAERELATVRLELAEMALVLAQHRSETGQFLFGMNAPSLRRFLQNHTIQKKEPTL